MKLTQRNREEEMENDQYVLMWFSSSKTLLHRVYSLVVNHIRITNTWVTGHDLYSYDIKITDQCIDCNSSLSCTHVTSLIITWHGGVNLSTFNWLHIIHTLITHKSQHKCPGEDSQYSPMEAPTAVILGEFLYDLIYVPNSVLPIQLGFEDALDCWVEAVRNLQQFFFLSTHSWSRGVPRIFTFILRPTDGVEIEPPSSLNISSFYTLFFS